MKFRKVPYRLRLGLDRGEYVNNIYTRDIFADGHYSMGHRGQTLKYAYDVNLKRKLSDQWKRIYRTNRCSVPWWGDDS